MLPDFSKYSLALVKDDQIIFSTVGSGLQPIIDVIKGQKGSGLTLFDSTIGLAAARLIVHSQMFSKVVTLRTSVLAKDLLEQNNIVLQSDIVVPHILRKDNKGICPMELKAMDLSNEDFFNEVIL